LGLFLASSLTRDEFIGDQTLIFASISVGNPSRRPSQRNLVSLAVNIDLVAKLRETSARHRDPTEMLLDWMEEMPIDEIKRKHGGYWDDGDILLLGEYTAIALEKISAFLRRRKLTKTAELLGERLRYGVKKDIINAGLIRLPLVMKNKARVLTRTLRNNGYTTLKQLSEEEPRRLAALLATSTDQAELLVREARMITGTSAS
jgi:replicative superfamily II helicase